MGGHGGLNILPQKRWNVYNFDNREKVRKDEEAAAKDEQIKRQQSRKHDTELRLQHLRQSRGLLPSSSSPPPDNPKPEPEPKQEANSKHVNLFEGIRIFDPSVKKDVVDKSELVLGNELRRGLKKMRKEAAEEVKPVLPEDEKYRLGYGVAGKGVKVPWYMDGSRKHIRGDDAVRGVDKEEEKDEEMVGRKRKKKSVEELREERLKREAREKERERALLSPKGTVGRSDRGRGGGRGGYSNKR